MYANINELATQIIASLPAGVYAKAWTGKRQDRIYIREGKKELCHYELYPEKSVVIRNGKNFGMFNSTGQFRLGTDEDFGASILIAAGYKIQRGT